MYYGEIAFSDAAKELQEDAGSRRIYELAEKRHVTDGLTENEKLFIGLRAAVHAEKRTFRSRESVGAVHLR